MTRESEIRYNWHCVSKFYLNSWVWLFLWFFSVFSRSLANRDVRKCLAPLIILMLQLDRFPRLEKLEAYQICERCDQFYEKVQTFQWQESTVTVLPVCVYVQLSVSVWGFAFFLVYKTLSVVFSTVFGSDFNKNKGQWRMIQSKQKVKKNQWEWVDRVDWWKFACDASLWE